MYWDDKDLDPFSKSLEKVCEFDAAVKKLMELKAAIDD